MNRSDPELERIAGADLLALVRARPEVLVSLTEISSLRSSIRRRAAFRLDFESGVTLKGRRFESADRARRIARLLAMTGDGFPRVIAHQGDALLLQWVDGPTLAALDHVPREVMTRCGRMLGMLHRLDTPPWWASGSPSPADVITKLHRDIGILAAADEIDVALGRAAVDTALAAAPSLAGAGMVHKDFCAENIVLDGSGAPKSIDNANLSVGPYDLDLARTWYRWPMTPADWSGFLQGYEACRDASPFKAHFAFWSICVLAGSASSRLRSRVGRHREPIERLRRLLDGLG